MATFDDPNLVSCGGLVPVAALAEQCGLGQLLERHVAVRGTAGANASAKASSVVFGMVAGADSIDDLDLLRHGGMRRLFADARTPSTLGTFLRAFRFGHIRQLDAVAARLLSALAVARRCCPAPVRRPSSTSTTSSGRCTATPSKVPASATAASEA